MSKKVILFIGLLVLGAALLSACAGEPGPAGPAGPAGAQGEVGPAGPAGADAAVTCVECHDSTDKITEKQTAWAGSLHGTNTSYLRGTSKDCAGCHSGGGFSSMVAAGLTPFTLEAGDAEPTRQDCRTCHEIHTTYTGEDWALKTTAAVTLADGTVFDGGSGNLCATCHQPRRFFAAVDGKVDVNSTHWGPHHGPQSAMLLGVGGGGAVEGKAGAHAKVENTCVGCHLNNHGFEPSLAACKECHTDAENFDIGGVQTQVTEKLGELLHALEAAGMYHDGHPVVGIYDEAKAAALWNYIYISAEDKSLGVHNPGYTLALIEASLEALK